MENITTLNLNTLITELQHVAAFHKIDISQNLSTADAIERTVKEVIKMEIFETRYYPELIKEIEEYNKRHAATAKQIPTKERARQKFVAYTPPDWQEKVNSVLSNELSVVRTALGKKRDPIVDLNHWYER
jgi:hypothetical protein